MKHLLLIFILYSSFHGSGQNKTLSIVPDSCSYVIGLDLKRITARISVDEVQAYQFVRTITENYLQIDPKTFSLKNVGIDYAGHAYYFSGGGIHNSYSGTILPVLDKTKFINGAITDKEIRQSLLNTGRFVAGNTVFYIQDNVFVAATVSATEELAFNKTDSLYAANGWEIPFRWDYWGEEIDWDAMEEELEALEEALEEIEELPLEEENYEDGYPYEEESAPYVEYAPESTPIMDEERYYEIKDSLLLVLSEKEALLFVEHLNSKNYSLLQNSSSFKNASVSPSDAFLFINSNALYSNSQFPYSIRRSGFIREFESYLKDTWQAAYLNFEPTGMKINWKYHMGEPMASITSAMTGAKLDKKLLHYIPANSNGFAVINMNSGAAYSEAKSLFMPILDKSDDPNMLLASAIWSLMDELIDEDALFDMSLSNAFLSYNGFREMRVETTTFDFDPETFESIERVENSLKKIPAITMGLSSERSYLITKFMTAMVAQGNGYIQQEGDYFKMKSGPIPGVPFYVMVKDDIVLLTNEQDLVRNHPEGYGNMALSGPLAKKAAKSKMMYAHFDWENLPEELTEFINNPADQKFVKALSSKAGAIELELGEIGKDFYSYQATFTFHGDYKSGAHYLMDIFNLMMSYEDEYYDDF